MVLAVIVVAGSLHWLQHAIGMLAFCDQFKTSTFFRGPLHLLKPIGVVWNSDLHDIEQVPFTKVQSAGNKCMYKKIINIINELIVFLRIKNVSDNHHNRNNDRR